MRELQAFIERLTIAQGRSRGEPFKLLPWERRFVRGAFSQPGDASLSVARGNGKSTLIAGIAWATVAPDGPLMQPGAECVVVASSFLQGTVIFRHALAFAQPWIERDPKRYRLQDSAQLASITDRETGASLRCLGNDPRRMHGLAPALVIGDELAQWESTKIDRALSALQTGLGKIPDSRALWIGTRAAAGDHPFEFLLRSGGGYSQIHAAKKGAPDFQRRTWERANPSLKYMPDLLVKIQQEAARARQDPNLLQSFRALRLNKGVADVLENYLLHPDTWMRCEVDEPDRRGSFLVGLDLGQDRAMSAAVGYWPETGYSEAFAFFPETPDLLERGRRDGVDRLYCRLAERGELLTAGLRIVDNGALLDEILRRWGQPAVIVADNYREGELRENLAKRDFPLCDLIVRRMGFYTGDIDVRDFRRAVLEGQVRPLKSLLMRAALGNARVAYHAGGNVKMIKGGDSGRRRNARDDAASAALLVIAEGRRRAAQVQARPAFQYAIV